VIGFLRDKNQEVPVENGFVGFDAYQYVLDEGLTLVILATPPSSALNISQQPFRQRSTYSLKSRYVLTPLAPDQLWQQQRKPKEWD
jgi:hypothetical protein